MKPTYFCGSSGASSIIDTSPALVYEQRDGVLVTRVHTHESVRGKGMARELWKQCLADADAEGVTLCLEINPYGDMNREQLTAWYIRLGFEEQPLGYLRRLPIRVVIPRNVAAARYARNPEGTVLRDLLFERR